MIPVIDSMLVRNRSLKVVLEMNSFDSQINVPQLTPRAVVFYVAIATVSAFACNPNSPLIQLKGILDAFVYFVIYGAHWKCQPTRNQIRSTLLRLTNASSGHCVCFLQLADSAVVPSNFSHSGQEDLQPMQLPVVLFEKPVRQR